MTYPALARNLRNPCSGLFPTRNDPVLLIKLFSVAIKEPFVCHRDVHLHFKQYGDRFRYDTYFSYPRWIEFFSDIHISQYARYAFEICLSHRWISTTPSDSLDDVHLQFSCVLIFILVCFPRALIWFAFSSTYIRLWGMLTVVKGTQYRRANDFRLHIYGLVAWWILNAEQWKKLFSNVGGHLARLFTSS